MEKPELNFVSKEALDAIRLRDLDRLANAIMTRPTRDGTLRGFFASHEERFAPYLLSAAISRGWLEGARLLMPFENQWGAVHVNWNTKQPAAVSFAKWSPSDMDFWEDIPCTPMGFACISGQADCVAEILGNQGPARAWPVDSRKTKSTNPLSFLIEQGASAAVETYLEGGGNPSPRQRGERLADWAIIKLLRESLPMARSGTEKSREGARKAAGEIVRSLAKRGERLHPKRGANGEFLGKHWAESLWIQSLLMSAPEVAAELMRGGIKGWDFPPVKGAGDGGVSWSPLAVAAGQSDPRMRGRAVETVSAILSFDPANSLWAPKVLAAAKVAKNHQTQGILEESLLTHRKSLMKLTRQPSADVEGGQAMTRAEPELDGGVRLVESSPGNAPSGSLSLGSGGYDGRSIGQDGTPGGGEPMLGDGLSRIAQKARQRMRSAATERPRSTRALAGKP